MLKARRLDSAVALMIEDFDLETSLEIPAKILIESIKYFNEP